MTALNDTTGPQGLVPSLPVFGIRALFVFPPRSSEQRQLISTMSAVWMEADRIACDSHENAHLIGERPRGARNLLTPNDKVDIYRENS